MDTHLDIKIKKEEEDDDLNDEKTVDDRSKFRASLYKLNEECNLWSEIGIGHVSTCHVKVLNSMFLMMTGETDNALLLLCKIQADIGYRRQQGRFITWTEDEAILGLSFQDQFGCEDIWNIICQVQGKDPSVEYTQDIPTVDEVEDTKANKVSWFEEMLDFDHVELSSYEKSEVQQLIQRVIRRASEDVEPTEGLKELHKNLLYLLKH